MTAYALPGLMPPTSPRLDSQVVWNWYEPLELVVREEDESLPEKSSEWWVSPAGAGSTLGRQQGSKAITTRVVGGVRQYVLGLPAKYLPRGTHLFQVVIDGELSGHLVGVPATLENRRAENEKFPAPII